MYLSAVKSSEGHHSILALKIMLLKRDEFPYPWNMKKNNRYFKPSPPILNNYTSRVGINLNSAFLLKSIVIGVP